MSGDDSSANENVKSLVFDASFTSNRSSPNPERSPIEETKKPAIAAKNLFPMKAPAIQLRRDAFTRGEQIGSGSYATVFKVKFISRELESTLLNGAREHGKIGQFYALKEMLGHKFEREGRV